MPDRIVKKSGQSMRACQLKRAAKFAQVSSQLCLGILGISNDSLYVVGAGLQGFWNSLAVCRDLPQATPPDRWDVERQFSMPGSESGTYARFGAYCSGLQDFDAAYFMLPTSEALAIDPHTRHLLHLTQVCSPDVQRRELIRGCHMWVLARKQQYHSSMRVTDP